MYILVSELSSKKCSFPEPSNPVKASDSAEPAEPEVVITSRSRAPGAGAKRSCSQEIRTERRFFRFAAYAELLLRGSKVTHPFLSVCCYPGYKKSTCFPCLPWGV